MALNSYSRSETTWRPLVLVVLIAVILTVWQHAAWERDRVSLPEYIAYYVTVPVQTQLSAVFRKLHDIGLVITAAPRLAEENQRLKRRCRRLQALRIETINAIVQNKAFREKLGLRLQRPFDKTAAHVISRSSSRRDRWVRIRAAGGKPIHVGDVVREEKGLVGRVVETSGSIGRVVLLSDAHHAVRGKDLRTNEEGMVYACDEFTSGQTRLKMEKTRRGARIMKGDIIVTSELGQTYPPGIPIGTVEMVRGSPSNVNSLTAYIDPYVNFDMLDYVYVLRSEMSIQPGE